MRATIVMAVMLLAPASAPGGAPAMAQTYDQLRKWCYGQATPEQTIQGCDAVIKANRETPEDLGAAFFNRGLTYHGKGQYDRAIQDYGQALKLRPNYPDALYQRGLAYRRSGQNDRAMQDYDQALRLKPDLVDALNSRCYLKAIIGQLQPALLDCNEALRLNPKNQFAFDSRAFAYLKLGMLDAAISDYSMALQIEPGRPYSLYGRGVARRKRGDGGGNSDIAAAKAKIPGIADEFAKYGVRVD